MFFRRAVYSCCFTSVSSNRVMHQLDLWMRNNLGKKISPSRKFRPILKEKKAESYARVTLNLIRRIKRKFDRSLLDHQLAL
ncbi:hypothetical protein I7I51_06269 [Histoplasma capsulatum]|uniref:Uncharacterized protein n=1 Tax=Ajellomyces capsulatus TaxID=5037 RepID=A0A8A1MG04_AJECA|nr:hypothetical protein I7I51_06269 [Histoplasma capsulatum]